MKRFVFVLALAAIIATGTAFADHPKGFGIGVVGNYSFAGFGGMGGGLSLKFPGIPIYWALNLGFGENYLGFGITGDSYLIDKNLAGPLHWFFGLGGYFSYYGYTVKGISGFVDEHTYSWMYGGVRVPIGLSLQPIPLLEIFIDVAPSIGVGIYSGYEYKSFGITRKESGTVGLGWGIPTEVGLRFWF
jgi:hypothetical protein